MTLGERLLLAFSKSESGVNGSPDEGAGSGSPLSLLYRVYPDFADRIRGKTILDFGCGRGLQSVALAEAGAARVVGVDSNPRTLAQARERLQSLQSPLPVEFHGELSGAEASTFDVVISQNAMEHYGNPKEALEAMGAAVKPDSGQILVTFGPPWLAPYGSHMHFFTSLPWVNILFPESTVMRVRARYRSDGAKRYEDVESGLNKMTVKRFERLVAQSGLEQSFRRYDCVKGLNFLGALPGAREFFINHVTVVLHKPQRTVR